MKLKILPDLQIFKININANAHFKSNIVKIPHNFFNKSKTYIQIFPP